jgi:hypothetical protein
VGAHHTKAGNLSAWCADVLAAEKTAEGERTDVQKALLREKAAKQEKLAAGKVLLDGLKTELQQQLLAAHAADPKTVLAAVEKLSDPSTRGGGKATAWGNAEFDQLVRAVNDKAGNDEGNDLLAAGKVLLNGLKTELQQQLLAAHAADPKTVLAAVQKLSGLADAGAGPKTWGIAEHGQLVRAVNDMAKRQSHGQPVSSQASPGSREVTVVRYKRGRKPNEFETLHVGLDQRTALEELAVATRKRGTRTFAVHKDNDYLMGLKGRCPSQAVGSAYYAAYDTEGALRKKQKVA